MFRKKQKSAYSPEEFEPVLKCSICTREQVLCLRHRQTGQLRELELVGSQEELAAACRRLGLEPEKLPKIY